MNKIFLNYFIRFILIILLQIVILNRISLWGFVTPMVYFVFILSLPFKTPRWVVILLGFFIGITVDFFTGGIIGPHAFAALFIAFIRLFIIRIITIRKEREKHLLPIFHDMRFIWYLQYVLILTFVHHFVYFFVDILSFHNFFQAMIVVLSNTACSMICIFIIQILFYKKSKRY
jgi:rod shape-determining protein MreD